MLSGLQQTVVIDQQFVPFSGKALPVNAEPRTVEGVHNQNNDGNIQIRIDGSHETATEQPTDHSSSTFLFRGWGAFRVLKMINFFSSPKSLQNVSRLSAAREKQAAA